MAKPVISVFRASTSTVQPGGTLYLVVTLSERATATITVHRLLKGKRKGKRCVKPSRKLRTARKCTRARRVGRPIVRTLRGGLSNVAVPVARKARPGRYRATVVVRDAAGNVSLTGRATYRVEKR